MRICIPNADSDLRKTNNCVWRFRSRPITSFEKRVPIPVFRIWDPVPF